MLKNPLMESLRKGLTKEEQAQIDDSFALADRIAYLLKKHQISQRQLAEKLGKRESEISKWLSGNHNFTQSTLTKISCAIGEPIYNIPKTDETRRSETIEHVNDFLRATITRKIKESSLPKQTDFKAYPKELSRIVINSEGAIFHPVHQQQGEFNAVKLNPKNFNQVERENAI